MPEQNVAQETSTFEEFWKSLVPHITSLALKIVATILVLIIGRIIIKAICRFITKSRFAKKTDPTVTRILQNFVSATLYVLLTVCVISILGVPMASIIAVIASAGVAIGLALQGSLSNFAGGIMIMLFKPFHIGDFVEANGHTGTVSDIDVFYTFITTPDNKVITVPNGEIMGHAITNFSVKDSRRVDFVFNVAYGTDVETVKNILLEEAGKHELVLKDPEPFARLSKQNSSSLDFTLRVWCKASDYWQVNFDVLESVNNRFVKENIEVPFNQLDVHVKPEEKKD